MQHRSAAVASRCVELALRGESFRVSDVRRGLDDPPSRQTIYRVLSQLEADDWVRRDGHDWRPATKADFLGDPGDDRDRCDGFDLRAEDLL